MLRIKNFVSVIAFAIGACTAGAGYSADQANPGESVLRDGVWTLTASLSLEELSERLGGFEEGQWTLRMAGSPVCSVDVYHYEYETVGGHGEPVTASSALMVPRGDDEKCSNSNPIIIGLHGTVPDRPYNLADVSGANPASGRALAWAGVYAAQGYIVVAPNFIGLDTSNSDYQSYHHAEQQTQDVIDALSGAREMLPMVSAEANDDLFLVGYSQGGWLAMATHRELEARGLPLTASVPMSGAYALSALVDNIFKGRPVRGSTLYFPMALRAFQEGYGNVYSDPEEVYNSAIANDVSTLLPSNVPHYTLIAEGRLPASNLFAANPDISSKELSPFVANIIENASPATGFGKFAEIYATGFGPNYLLSTDYRISYLQDIEAHPDGAFPVYTTGLPPASSNVGFRQAAIDNDLRNWTPQAPLMMCGGPSDGVVDFKFGGQAMMQYWSDPERAPEPGTVSLLNFEAPFESTDEYADLLSSFKLEREQIENGQAWPVWVDPYHQFLLPRYCYLAARNYFDAMR